jgi:hypothetical protein
MMAIRCPNGHENVDGAFFCEQCGVALEAALQSAARVCATCGLPNAPAAITCANCGMPLAATVGAESQIVRLVHLASGQSFEVGDQREAVIGRADPTCDVFPEIDLTPIGGEKDGVSRQHARLRRDRDRFTIEDLKSVNFTFLNKQRLDAFAPTQIKSGDEVRLGRVVLRFEVVAG